MYYLISKRLILVCWSFFVSTLVFAQNIITGTVTDEENNPLPGVTVRLIKAKTGTITDQQGRFVLKGNWDKGERLSSRLLALPHVHINLMGRQSLMWC